MTDCTKRSVLSLILLFMFSGSVYGYSSNHWQHRESPGFTISYNEKTAHLVDEAFAICHETAQTIGTYFGWDIAKDHISVVLSDHYDETQGESLWALSLVRIDARKTEMSFYRGETEQLRTLLTHELTHVYALRIMKSLWTINIGVSAVSKDVLASAYTATDYTKIPQWFIEGIAQMGSLKLDADGRDAYREMVLKDAFRHHRLLTLAEMGIFEGTSREYELVYNQGFDFLLFLQKTYPEKPLKTICAYTRDLGFVRGVQRFYNKSLETLYDEWVENLSAKYYGNDEDVAGKPLYPEKHRPLITEVMSVEMGKYVISNWAHDMNRFDLMVMDEKRESVVKRIKDTGKILKKDPWDGSVYFNKAVYNRETGVLNYDIYKLDRKNRQMRVTKGKRCLAFDVKNGWLMVAAYKNGQTEIVVKPPEDDAETRITFDHHTAVYGISMVDENSAILTLGTGKNKTAAILSGNSLHYLWKNLPGDVFDCIYAGDGRMVFSSTVEGFPQLYWTNISKNPYLWYRLTHVAGGARLPSVEREDENAILFFTLYENGQHLRYFLTSPFSTETPVNIGGIGASEIEELSSFHPSPETDISPVLGNFVMAMPTLNLRYGRVASGGFWSGKDITGLYSVGSTVVMLNAPGNIEMGVSGDLNFPVGYETSGLENFSYEAYLSYHLGKLRFRQGIERNNYHSEVEFESEGMDFIAVLAESENELETELGYQLFDNDVITAAYRFRFDDREDEYSLKENGVKLRTVDRGRIFESHGAAFSFDHFYERSVFDPGGLGAPCFQVTMGVAYYHNRYPAFKGNGDSGESDVAVENEEDEDEYDYDDADIVKISAQMKKQMMFLGNRLSLAVLSDGFYYNGGRSSGKITPYAYDFLGEEDYFSGYTPYEVKVRESYRFGLGMKFNPFINVLTPTKKVERMNMGIFLEGGGISYFQGSMKTAHPISAECTFSYFFHFWRDRKSAFFITYARPLEKIDRLQESLSGRVYLGLDL